MIKTLNSPFKNESGAVLVQAIVATVVIAVAALTIMQRSLDINRQLRLPRIKAAQNNVEFSLRHLLLQPTTYTGCNTSAGFAASCSLATGPTSAVAAIQEIVPGCNAPVCRVSVTDAAFNATSRTFTGNIRYSGTEVIVQAMPVSIVVPLEVLQSAQITCTNPDLPFFMGFNADGTPNCRGFTAPCGPGQYVKGFNASNLSLVCQNLPTTAINCAPGFITSMTWNAGSLTHTCGPRVPPSSVWPTNF